MKLKLYTITKEKLEAMAKRLKERIAANPIPTDKGNLLLIEKEIAHRVKIHAQGQEELSKIKNDDPNKDIRISEIEFRTRLQLFDRESREYAKLYSRWFELREKGLVLKLWPFFTPEGGKNRGKLYN